MMAKKKLVDWIWVIIGLITSIGIGGLFVAGTFTTTVILSMLPAIIHTIVGYTIIAGAILGLVLGWKK